MVSTTLVQAEIHSQDYMMPASLVGSMDEPVDAGVTMFGDETESGWIRKSADCHVIEVLEPSHNEENP